MSINWNKLKIGLVAVCFMHSGLLGATEWKTEPHVGFSAQYNDNVRLNTDKLAEASFGTTISPSVKVQGVESTLWDVSLEAKGRLTQYYSAEDADSNDVFFAFDTNRKSERTNLGLNMTLDNVSNFNTDLNNGGDPGLTSDRTDRTTATIAPSITWQMSETSQIAATLSLIDVSYDEVTSVNLKDYKYNSLNVSGSWAIAQNHRLGFTASYAAYDSPATLEIPAFSFDQVVLQMDYDFTINQVSNLILSIGERSIDSTAQITTQAPDTVSNEDRGLVLNASYSRQTEKWSQTFSAARTVIPSSFGSAQEENRVTYRLSYKKSERLSANLILNASETTTLQGLNTSNDRQLNRVQPSIRYRINKNWNVDVQYRRLFRRLVDTNDDRVSNAVFVNFSLNWPKLASTY